MKKYAWICLFLLGCAHRQPLDYSELQPQAETFQWHAQGVLAAQRGKEHWSANYDWTYVDNRHYQIRLFGPLGSRTVLITNDGGLITYQDGKHISHHTNMNQLLQELTGVPIPVNAINQCLLGRTNPIVPGYEVRYLSYQTIGNKTLPRKIHIHGQGSTIKIIVKHVTRESV